MTTTILKIISLFSARIRNSTNQAPLLHGLALIPVLLMCVALLPGVQAAPGEGLATPHAPREAPAGPEIQEGAPTAPQAPLPGFNTADGDHALFNVTTGSSN